MSLTEIALFVAVAISAMLLSRDYWIVGRDIANDFRDITDRPFDYQDWICNDDTCECDNKSIESAKHKYDRQISKLKLEIKYMLLHSLFYAAIGLIATITLVKIYFKHG